jgi:hypothetical protein
VKALSDIYQRFIEADEALLLRLMQAFIAIAIILYLVPYLILGAGNHWMIWDNLDSNYVAYKVLIESGTLFASNATIIEQPLGGVARGTMASEFDAFVWLYILFGPEGAYIVNRILMVLVGFIGMYLLLRRHVIKEDGDEVVRLGVSLCFALLPFYPFGGLSVAGMPLALYAMLEIRNRNHSWWNWAVVVLYPFYSSLVLSGFFFLFLVMVIWLCDVLRRKSILPLFLALAVMSLFYVFTHYRIFIDFLVSPNSVSHRIEFVIFYQSSLKEALKETLSIFIGGVGHAHSLQQYYILPLISLSVFLMLPRSKNDRKRWLFWLIMIALGSIASFSGFKSTPMVSAILAPIWAVLPLQLDRFYFLYPLLWMLALALVLTTLRRHAPILGLVVIAVVVLQSAYAFRHHELIWNHSTPSVGQFLAKEQFAEIQEYIGRPLNTYRVASLGIHPSVSLYNGFHTLDGYWSNYSLSYKHAFREVIAGELEKNVDIKRYFDDWGSRVYLFNSTTGTDMLVRAGNGIIIRELGYNWNAFYDLGGRYLLSAVEIDISTNPNLMFEGKFEDSASAWDVYLYRVTSL